MEFSERINKLLKPPKNLDGPLVVDLFSGAGGLSLGFEAQGFRTIGYESDANCCSTYNKNLGGESVQVELTPDSEIAKADIIIGGPPCQPFSETGKSKGLDDSRDGFPIFVSIIKRERPLVWMFENVPGMVHEKNVEYLIEIKESLKEHYNIIPNSFFRHAQEINCADYGVPQTRKRIFVVGYRKGIFSFPEKTHISRSYVTVGEALGESVIQSNKDSKFLTPSQINYIRSYEEKCELRTTRDLHMHIPARTVTTRNVIGATADMLRIKLPDGRKRMLTLREAARLQSFPDWFDFEGSESSVAEQIGNAIPPLLAYHLAGSFNKYLSTVKSEKSIITEQVKSESSQLA